MEFDLFNFFPGSNMSCNFSSFLTVACLTTKPINDVTLTDSFKRTWVRFVDTNRTVEFLEFSVIPLYRLVVRTAGIFGSVSLFYIVSRFQSSNQYLFRSFMYCVSLCDTLYNCFGIAYTVVTYKLQSCQCCSAFRFYAIVVLPGLIALASSLSEYGTLLVVYERYASLCRPHFWQSFNRYYRRRFLLLSLLVCSLFSSTRLLYVMLFTVTWRWSHADQRWCYTLVPANMAADNVFSIVSDVIDLVFPTALLTVMVVATVRILRCIQKRDQVHTELRNVPVQRPIDSGQASNHQPAGGNHESNQMYGLVFILSFIFCLSQLFWLFYKVTSIVENEKSLITADSSAAVIAHWHAINLLYHLASILCTVFESLNHIATFYSYMTFSTTFRRRFLATAKRDVDRLLTAVKRRWQEFNVGFVLS